MQIKEGGDGRGRGDRRRDHGPRERRARAAQGRRARRRPLRPPDRRRARGLRRLRHRLRAGEGARVESPDLVLLGQQSDDGECYTIGAVVADHLKMPSLTQVIKIDVEDGKLTLRAPGRVRLRHRRGRAAGRDQRRRRDQRAALPVAEGDHGREEEAARHARAPATSASRPTASARSGSRTQVLELNPPPEKEAGEIIEDEDTNETVEKIVAWLDERKLI